MRIYFIRHGQTDANAKRVIQGWLDTRLNAQGRALARETAKGLADVRFDAVFSSPLSRALETARILLEENRHPAPAITTDLRLREIGFGRLEGLGFGPENRGALPKDFRRFFTDPWRYEKPEGGETIAELCARTAAFLGELLANPALQDRTVLVSTHGCALRALLHRVYDDPQDFWHGRIPSNCSVSIVDVLAGVPRLVGDDRVFYDPALVDDLMKAGLSPRA